MTSWICREQDSKKTLPHLTPSALSLGSIGFFRKKVTSEARLRVAAFFRALARNSALNRKIFEHKLKCEYLVIPK
jgi:hypothetical protein